MLNSRYAAGEKDNAYEECKLIHDFTYATTTSSGVLNTSQKTTIKFRQALNQGYSTKNRMMKNGRLIH